MTLHAASRDMTTAPTARHTPNVPEADVQVPEVESGETGSPKLPVSASTPRHHAPGKAPAQSRRVLVGVRRGAAVEVPPVSDFPGRFFTMAEQFEKLAQRPQADDGPWGMGFGCEQGFVRADNQDYGIAYRIGGFQVLIIADGVGGTDWGREAAYFATLHAASSLARRLGRARGLTPIDLEHAAFAALVAAAHALARVSDKLGVTTLSAGLRTTLLVVVAAPQEIGFACCGDGLVAVAGADGRVRQLLQPLKAAGHPANVLACSMGPRTEGVPVSGSVARNPGDLVVAATDGIADRVTADFPAELARAAHRYQGALQALVDDVLTEALLSTDERGHSLFDDNASLGLIGTLN